MAVKSVAITQSNYIPWKGYFDSMAAVDTFILLDDVQYTRRDWRNRNLIKTPHGVKWLTIPVEVSGKYFQHIQDTRVANMKWSKTHWAILQDNYKNAPFFGEISDWLKPLYLNCKLLFLSEINFLFLTAISNFLGIATEIRWSREFPSDLDKNRKLIRICRAVQATDYFSGEAAKAYLANELFERNKIKVHFWQYSGYREYCQLYLPFEHRVSVLDLLFMKGEKARNFMKMENRRICNSV